MPLTLEVGELPTADELGRLRHPQWFVRAEKLLRESRLLSTMREWVLPR